VPRGRLANDRADSWIRLGNRNGTVRQRDARWSHGVISTQRQEKDLPANLYCGNRLSDDWQQKNPNRA
jgi:hypothetical protein